MRRGSLVLMLIGCLAAAPMAAFATSITTTASSFTGDPLEVQLTFDDAGGEIRVDVSVVSGDLGDLRGVFLNLADTSLLDGLTVVGPHVANTDTSGSVINLGGGANVNGGGTPCPCDLGVEIGSPGVGKNDIQSTWFVISHVSESLDLSLLTGQFVGVRVTSVGEDREGSSKLSGVIVPEPAVATLLATAALLGLRRRTLA